MGKEEPAAYANEKKKKKRILGAQPPPTFNWDPVMNVSQESPHQT